MAKPLFALLSWQKRQGWAAMDWKLKDAYCKLIPEDWSEKRQNAFEKVKTMLRECVVLAHQDFDEPFTVCYSTIQPLVC